MDKDTIYRQDAIDAIEEVDWYHQNKNKDMVSGANSSEHQAWYKADDIYKALEALPSAQPEPQNVVEIPETGIGDLSDGYHTFNGLYEQRMILFAALVKAYKGKAWKSYRHEDGEYCFGGGWFIVGVDTPEGSYTYHYENKYWDMFDCVDLPRGKHWDGHTEADAETRLMSLEPERKQVEIEYTEWNEEIWGASAICGNCGCTWQIANNGEDNFCPNCGTQMIREGGQCENN